MTTTAGTVATTLLLSEVFGPTVQGEGPSAGRRCAFVRTSECNLRCTWCDTPYTWRWSDHDRAAEQHEASVAAVIESLGAMDPGMVVVSGGEPLLQRRAVAALLAACHALGWETEVETNGTIPPHGMTLPTRFNVSPKLSHSGDSKHERLRPRALAELRDTGRATFKFVVATLPDFDEVAEVVQAYALAPANVWIMPQARTREELHARLPILTDAAVARGWNVSSRLQVLAWGGRRGH